MDLPSHPEADEPDPASPADRGLATTDRRGVVVVAVLAALVVAVVILHLAGVVGPGAH